MRAAIRPRSRVLRPGDVVEVRSADEILATLGPDASVDGLPFQPEMLAHCGSRFVVDSRTDTTCFLGILRHLPASVHLTGLRCDGSAHGGCQAGCLLYWKEEWLRVVDDPPPSAPAIQMAAPVRREGCTEEDLAKAVHPPESDPGGEELWSCQATRILQATTRLAPWDLRHYLTDLRNRNVRLRTVLRFLLPDLINAFQGVSRRHLPRWLCFRGGKPFPFVHGRLTRTPAVRLDLQPGETVRILSRREIRKTVDRNGKNRGLSFDGEMAPYCGQVRRVDRVISRIIDEYTGRMLTLPGRSLVLEGVVCQGRYHGLCQRKTQPFWREAWLTPHAG
ncbi:hypothetical protein GCM10027261_19120 [Geodermatophilus arenarius]|uniref:Uncharacterized protein n=1 Tax=Geodermatophilus arenarius TaxID=1137990 RepID=A0ABV9LI06_9ACTN